MTVFVSNTNLLELLGLQDAIDSSYINDATVSVSLVDHNGVAITGQTWPTTMPYVASSNGNYRCAILDTCVLAPGQVHTAKINVTAGARKGHWELKFTPEVRD
jgi:hypothetical protein